VPKFDNPILKLNARIRNSGFQDFTI